MTGQGIDVCEGNLLDQKLDRIIELLEKIAKKYSGGIV
jgi:hypothetical protein